MRSLAMIPLGLLAVWGAWVAYELRPRQLVVAAPAPCGPFLSFEAGRASATFPGLRLAADWIEFEDELFAYLMFGYARGLAAQDGRTVWMTCDRKGRALRYVIRLDLGNDLLAAEEYLRRLGRESGMTAESPYWLSPEAGRRFADQSRQFDRAYNMAAPLELEKMPRRELAAYVRRFIRFKANTDGRVRRGIEPVPSPPGSSEAARLAEDIVAVAEFFSLPIDFFLGIGAMENNYMNVRGDIGNSIWKRRAQKGDVILRRGPRGVLVLNESSGLWQITRETLRVAHRLYLADTRDYSTLPAHLRPPRELNLDDAPPALLTTYAGLFFRNLLDRFGGDVAKAVGAYNGGPGNPNPRYEAGARRVAEHARKVLEHAAALRGRPAAEMSFLTTVR